MPAKSNKSENASKKDAPQKSSGIKKSSAKSKKATEEDDFDRGEDEKETINIKKPSLAKNRDEDEDDVVDDIENEVDSIKGEEDEDWDPDFNEFDLPKSSKKTSLKKGSKDSDDEFKVDDEFQDYFGSSSSSRKYNKEDDDY